MSIRTIILGSTAVYLGTMPICGRLNRYEIEKDAVSRLLDFAIGSDFKLEHNPDGSPFVCGFSGSISISHCSGFAALAVNSGLRVGVDVELCRSRQLERVSARFLTDAERAVYGLSPELMLRAWTAKEAVYKSVGITGLPLKNICLSHSGNSADVHTPEDRVLSFHLHYIEELPMILSVAEGELAV